MVWPLLSTPVTMEGGMTGGGGGDASSQFTVRRQTASVPLPAGRSALHAGQSVKREAGGVTPHLRRIYSQLLMSGYISLTACAAPAGEA